MFSVHDSNYDWCTQRLHLMVIAFFPNCRQHILVCASDIPSDIFQKVQIKCIPTKSWKMDDLNALTWETRPTQLAKWMACSLGWSKNKSWLDFQSGVCKPCTWLASRIRPQRKLNRFPWLLKLTEVIFLILPCFLAFMWSSLILESRCVNFFLS